MCDQIEFKTRQKELKKEIEEQEDELINIKEQIIELKSDIKNEKQATGTNINEAQIKTLESKLLTAKTHLSDKKAEITTKRREYYIDFLYYHQKESPKLFYTVITFALTVLGAIVMFVKFMPDTLFIIDYAEPLNFVIGGLVNIYFWTSLILFAIVYWLIPKIKLNRYNYGQQNTRIGFLISWLYSIHKAPGCYATILVILVLPSTITNPSMTANFQSILKISGISPHYVNVEVSSPQACIPDLIPIYRSLNYQVFKNSASEKNTVMAIPINNIAAIETAARVTESSPPNEKDAEENADDSNNSICVVPRSIDDKNAPITFLPILLSSAEVQESHITNLISATNQTIENLNRTLLEINYQVKVEYAYIENFLSQEYGKSYRIRKELPTVYFKHGVSTLKKNADRTIEKIIDLLRTEAPGTHLLIVGYANTQGAPYYNQKLSEKRATAVRKKLKLALEDDENGIRYSHFNIYDEGIGDKNYELYQSIEGPTNRRARVFIVEPVLSVENTPNPKFKAAMNNE